VAFQDHFSAGAANYARARPTYPAELFERLANLAPGRGTAWDCGTGNGQAATGLATHFERVVATDPSAAQLAEAITHPRVSYRLGDESHSGLNAGSVDIVTAAQAAHWFDLPAFYGEARRVLRPDGVVAIWCYALCRIAPAIDEPLDVFYHQTVGPYWPPERRFTEDGYRSLPFPFPEISFPTLAMELEWTLAEFSAYLQTWSAVTRLRAARGGEPVVELSRALAGAWGTGRRRVVWPLAGRIGRVT
jgi:SAM-dependent methyltransferase